MTQQTPRYEVPQSVPTVLRELYATIAPLLDLIRQAQGYGTINVQIRVAKGQIAGWEAAPVIACKPESKR